MKERTSYCQEGRGIGVRQMSFPGRGPSGKANSSQRKNRCKRTKILDGRYLIRRRGYDPVECPEGGRLGRKRVHLTHSETFSKPSSVISAKFEQLL